MTKFFIHFPVFMAFSIGLILLFNSLTRTYWLLIPTWQAICIGIFMAADGKNREKRYRKILYLVERGKTLNSLPREETICGFFIRLAVFWQIRLGSARQKI
jgi:hypothetical protein